MPRGRDTSKHPNRRIDNVTFVDFGHPMQNHPAYRAKMEGKTKSSNDDAPPHGIKRPKLSKKEMGDD